MQWILYEDKTPCVSLFWTIFSLSATYIFLNIVLTILLVLTVPNKKAEIQKDEDAVDVEQE
jgi:hypothetical protein